MTSRPPSATQQLNPVVWRVVEVSSVHREVLGCALERRRNAPGLVQLRGGAGPIDLAGRFGRMAGLRGPPDAADAGALG